MIRVLIVDDDALIRVTLRSIVDWESLGYVIVQDCINGEQALAYLRNHSVDLLITDMQMPGVNGLGLMRELIKQGRLPLTLALSGYDEFELVREAFRLGAHDYLLKSDINKKSMEHMLKALKESYFQNMKPQASPVQHMDLALLPGTYMPVGFQVQGFSKVAQRFGANLKEQMEKPMLELVNQIQRLQGRAILHPVSPDYIELYYPMNDKTEIQARDTILSVTRQIQAVWQDFLNLETTAGISDRVDVAHLDQASKKARTLSRLAILQGRSGICTQWEHDITALLYEVRAAKSDNLIAALLAEDNAAAQKEMGLWFNQRKQQDPESSRQETLVLLARLGEKLHALGGDFYEIYPEGINFFKESDDLYSRQERELWLRSLLRRVQVSCAEERESKQLGPTEQAKRFMQDNFTDQALSLKTVAAYVGFNEKYFSTLFAKESGTTFIAYLNDLRIQRAQDLLEQTDLKMYEISEAVGYGSVEHFNHIFKKKLGKTPKEYRQTYKKA
jgi:two-component system response regulator YesN